jgi:hypothetical protein
MLVRAEELLDRARAILAAERELLTGLLGRSPDLVLLGGSSVPGALTRGDVDLHLAVPPAEFGSAVAAIRTVHEVVHPEIWQPTLATFGVRAALPAGLAVTPAGSVHDRRFRRAWARLAGEPELLAAYNAVKELGEDGYEERKAAFFDEVAGD